MKKFDLTSSFDDAVASAKKEKPSDAFVTPGDSNLPLVIGYDLQGGAAELDFLYAKK